MIWCDFRYCFFFATQNSIRKANSHKKEFNSFKNVQAKSNVKQKKHFMRQQKFFYLWYFLLFVDELFCSCPSEQLNEATWEILSRVSDCFVFSFSAWATLVCIYWKYLHESSDDITHVSCKYVLILNVSNFQPMHSLQHCIQATFSLFVCSHEIFDWSFSNASSSTATSDEVKFERSSQASIRHFTILKNFSFLCLRQLSARLSIDLIYVSQSENVFWLKFPIFSSCFSRLARLSLR